MVCSEIDYTSDFSVRSFKGHMLQAAPVSTKQCACDAESVWKNVRLLGSVWGDCAILGPLEISFASL